MSGKNLVLHLLPKILSTNQIVVFCDRQYLRQESVDILEIFLLANNHQWKVTSKATTFDWLLLGVPLVQSDCRIL